MAPTPSRPLLAALAALGLVACSAPQYHLSDEELARFEAAGPVVPEVDQDALLNSLPAPGPYRVVPGDLLQISAPHIFFETSADDTANPATPTPYLVRVNGDGDIIMPLVGEQPVAGETLLEIEAQLANAAYPKYLTHKPGIVARIEEYKRVTVSLMGAVEKPGLIDLRSDQMSLFGALSEAGGIARSGNLIEGAQRIRITLPGEDGKPTLIALPVKGLNIPFSDVALTGGERIEVERYEPDTFTVVGLVASPGAYAYPPEVDYNLMQALAVAGGVDMTADPPYATIFRKDATGQIIPATFDIDGAGLTNSSTLKIKPGDVIAVQHTAASWTRSFASEIFRISIGWDSRLNSN
jgi:protein involved in polysaccharide export with SLBB domain